MDSLDAAATAGLDDFLDFPSEICNGEDEEDEKKKQSKTITAFTPSNGTDSISSLYALHDSTGSFPELVEEELEWISNKDAFPGVETFVDIFPDSEYDLPKQNSPVSVLENSTSTTSSNTTNNSGATMMSCCRSLHVPVRARTKRCRKRRPEGLPNALNARVWWNQGFIKTKESYHSSGDATLKVTNIKMGRKCLHCGSEKTPQWRAGPQGPKTLCNACGVRYKSGRLVPEYRPANSPTFSNELHSNSHRKIIEMRKMKQMCDGSAMRFKDNIS